MLYMCMKYHIWFNMYHVNAQGVDGRMINVHSSSTFWSCMQASSRARSQACTTSRPPSSRDLTPPSRPWSSSMVTRWAGSSPGGSTRADQAATVCCLTWRRATRSGSASSLATATTFTGCGARSLVTSCTATTTFKANAGSVKRWTRLVVHR